MKFMHKGLLSTAVTFIVPREASSKLILQIPQNKSNAIIVLNSKSLLNILKRPSLALLVVGLAEILFGAFIILPL